MKRSSLIPLLFAWLALPAAAQEFGSVFAQPLPLVAQMSQEERRALRERWEEAGPEERAQLRRMFQERLQRVPPEQAAPYTRKMHEQMNERWRESGFGTGYESRRFEDDVPYDANRSGSDNDQRGRGRR